MLLQMNFSRGVGGVSHKCEKSRGVGGGGGVTFAIKMENPGRWGGVQKKFPLWWGYGYFLEPHFAQFFAIEKAHRDGTH